MPAKSPSKKSSKPALKPAPKAPPKSASKAPANSSKRVLPAPVSTGFWLLKSEPESYSIDKLASEKQTLWTGVRNYQARNYMAETMKPGEKFLFYHSNAEPAGVVGVGEIVRVNVADPTALDAKSEYHDPKSSKDHPIWFCAEVKFLAKFPEILPLEWLREQKPLASMPLLQKGSRLSVQQVSVSEFAYILKAAAATESDLH